MWHRETKGRDFCFCVWSVSSGRIIGKIHCLEFWNLQLKITHGTDTYIQTSFTSHKLMLVPRNLEKHNFLKQNYLFWKRDRGRERSVTSHVMVYSPDGCNSRCWARLKLEASSGAVLVRGAQVITSDLHQKWSSRDRNQPPSGHWHHRQRLSPLCVNTGPPGAFSVCAVTEDTMLRVDSLSWLGVGEAKWKRWSLW